MEKQLPKGRTQAETVWKNQKQLRSGYTTGSCAAAAAKAAAYMLLSKEVITQVSLLTPKGITLYLDIEQIDIGPDRVRCAVQKDSGDDPDITDGIYIYAEVKKTADESLCLDGGEGVGRVTKKGLQQEIGEAAINRVPRQMILGAVEEQRERFGYSEGGISVLGTSGIVEPMSEKALTDTIFLEMKVLKENGHDWCYVVPGNYGSDFLTETLKYDGSLAVKCSNYIGDTIDDAKLLGMKGILLIGHVGKLVKLAAGVMNTHSRQADCRMEVLASHAAMAGASAADAEKIMDCITTTEALDYLKERKLLRPVMETVIRRIEFHLRQRAGDTLTIGAVVFSKEEGILGKTKNAEELLEQIRREQV